MIRYVAIGAIGALAAALTACRLGTPEPPADAGGVSDMRSATTFRQWHGESRLNTAITLSGGSLRVVPGLRNELFRLTSSYNDETSVPYGVYDAKEGRLSIGRRAEKTDTSTITSTDGDNFTITIGGSQSTRDADDESDDHSAAASTLALSPAVSAALAINLIGTQGDVELGGLQTSSLDINALAGETSVRFSQPNGAACTRLEVNAGLSELSLTGLGNSRCQTLDVTGAAGHVTLDFAGSWPASATIHAKIVAGSLTIRVPRGVGVRLTPQDKVLAHLSAPDMARVGDTLVSANYASAARQLDIETTAVIGEISLERID